VKTALLIHSIDNLTGNTEDVKRFAGSWQTIYCCRS